VAKSLDRLAQKEQITKKPCRVSSMTNDNTQHQLNLSLSQMKELQKILKGHSRSLNNRAERGFEVPSERIANIETMLTEVSNTLLDIELFDIVGDSLCDDSVEKILETWRNSHG
jgi:hypothetical protein